MDRQNTTLPILNKYLEQATIDFFDEIEPLKEFFGKADNKLKFFYDNKWLTSEI